MKYFQIFKITFLICKLNYVVSYELTSSDDTIVSKLLSKNKHNYNRDLGREIDLKTLRVEIARMCKKRCGCKNSSKCEIVRNGNQEDAIGNNLVDFIQRYEICKNINRCGCAGGRCGEEKQSYDEYYDDTAEIETLDGYTQLPRNYRDHTQHNLNIEKINSEIMRNRKIDSLCKDVGRCGCSDNRCGDDSYRSDNNLNDYYDLDGKIGKETVRNILQNIKNDVKTRNNFQENLDRICREAINRCGVDSNINNQNKNYYYSDNRLVGKNLFRLNDNNNNKEGVFQNNIDRICSETGRCGDDSYKIDQTANDDYRDVGQIEKLLRHVNKDMDIKNNLEENTNRLCEETGRCGCSGDRCSDDLYRISQNSRSYYKDEENNSKILTDRYLRLIKNNLLREDKLIKDSIYKICRTTGRCGCGDGGCNYDSYRIDQNFNDYNSDDNKLEKLLRYVNNDMSIVNMKKNMNRICGETGRCGCSNNRCREAYTSSENSDEYDDDDANVDRLLIETLLRNINKNKKLVKNKKIKKQKHNKTLEANFLHKSLIKTVWEVLIKLFQKNPAKGTKPSNVETLDRIKNFKNDGIIKIDKNLNTVETHKSNRLESYKSSRSSEYNEKNLLETLSKNSDWHQNIPDSVRDEFERFLKRKISMAILSSKIKNKIMAHSKENKNIYLPKNLYNQIMRWYKYTRRDNKK